MNRRILVVLLIISHGLCIALGFRLGGNCSKIDSIPEATALTKEIVETTDSTDAIATSEEVIPTEGSLADTEAQEETTTGTEVTEVQDVPVYIPSDTTPSVTQPPVAEPPVINPPIAEPPATNPPSTQPPVDSGFGGGEF